MAGLLYFRPGPLVKPSLAEVQAAGLGYAFTVQPCARDVMGPGPGGKPGILFCDAARMGTAPIGYYGAAKQTWRKVPTREGEPELYIGWNNEQPPTPADLGRPDPLAGVAVKLGDGQSWEVPIVQEWRADDAAATRLPRSVTRTVDGQWVLGDVRPAWRAIWETSTKLWGIMIAATESSIGSPSITYEFDGLHDFACELLAINYAISWREVSALELFLPDTAARVCENAIEFPQFIEWLLEKKSAGESAGESSSDGQGESTETIGQR